MPELAQFGLGAGDGLVLPAPLDRAPVGAYVEHRRRLVVWSLMSPGSIARNRYGRARVEVAERSAWRGEPLWLSASRTMSEVSGWVPFTDAARLALHGQVVPVVARYGFDRLWTEVHGAQQSTDKVDAEAAAARREAAWWEAAGSLAELHRDGRLSFRRAPEDHGRLPTVLVVDRGKYGHTHREEVLAAAFHDGVRVGWITRFGALVPLGEILEAPAAGASVR